MEQKIKKIAVLCGGNSKEREVSLRSGNNVTSGLIELGYEVLKIDTAKDKIPENVDFVFLALHGLGGEDGSIQGYLEYIGIPYSGSGVLASSIAFNKIKTKEILSFHGLPTASFVCLNSSKDLKKISSYPAVIKPAEEGSSIGVYIVDNYDELLNKYNELKENYKQLFVEDFIKGIELTVSIVGKEIFPILEIRSKNRFYDYEAKYTKGAANFIIPAQINSGCAKNVSVIASKAYQVIGCSGSARVDFMLRDDGQPFITEINTIPGMTDTSDLPVQAEASGVCFNDLLQKIIDVSTK